MTQYVSRNSYSFHADSPAEDTVTQNKATSPVHADKATLVGPHPGNTRVQAATGEASHRESKTAAEEAMDQDDTEQSAGQVDALEKNKRPAVVEDTTAYKRLEELVIDFKADESARKKSFNQRLNQILKLKSVSIRSTRYTL